MPKIRVTKRFQFEMAHMLHGYDGLCRNIHGHSYTLEITLRGEPLNRPGHPKDGMVMDFTDLKNLVKAEIMNRFDHSFIVNQLVPEEQTELLRQVSGRIIRVDFQPTTENMVYFFVKILQEKIPAGVELFCVSLWETTTSFAAWFADDNTD